MRLSTLRDSSPSSGGHAEAQSPPTRSVNVRPRRRRAATAMEYLFVISLILVVAIMGMGYFGQQTKNSFQQSENSIGTALGR